MNRMHVGILIRRDTAKIPFLVSNVDARLLDLSAIFCADTEQQISKNYDPKQTLPFLRKANVTFSKILMAASYLSVS